MKRILLLQLIFLILSIAVFSQNQTKPIVVLGSLFLDINGSFLYPEVAIDENGKWREATIDDLWLNQKFAVFPYSYTESIDAFQFNLEGSITSISRLPVKLNTNINITKSSFCWGIYSKNIKFNNIGIDKAIFPENICNKAKSEFSNKLETKNLITNVVEYDWDNIQKSFPIKLYPSVVESMNGDLNGDGITDYVLLIGAGGFGNSEAAGAALIVYLSVNQEMKRLSVDYWEKTSDYSGWPKLLFMRDFNSDNAQELVISHSDTDTDTMIVYSWSKNGLVKVFEGKDAIWSGN